MNTSLVRRFTLTMDGQFVANVVIQDDVPQDDCHIEITTRTYLSEHAVTRDHLLQALHRASNSLNKAIQQLSGTTAPGP